MHQIKTWLSKLKLITKYFVGLLIIYNLLYLVLMLFWFGKLSCNIYIFLQNNEFISDILGPF